MTQLFLLDPVADWSSGSQDSSIVGTNVGWVNKALGTSRGAGIQTANYSTVAGPTAGTELVAGVGWQWVSPPLSAAVTISGSITFNAWTSEASMFDNVAINFLIDKLSPTGIFTQVIKTVRTIEVNVTTRAVNNWSETPAAGVAFAKGDRIRCRLFGDDAGTMGAGGSFSNSWGAASAAVDGDTYFTTTETISWTEPAGTILYPTSPNIYQNRVDPSTTWIDNKQGTSDFTSVAYGNGYFVAVGNVGTLRYSSDDGATWTSNPQGTVDFSGVSYGNGYWVASGASGNLYYKATDPTGAWTSNAQGTIQLYSAFYGNGYWVVTGNSGVVYYKATDPTGAWTSNTQGTAGLVAVYYGNGYWVATGAAGALIYRATDPTGAWTSNPQGSDNLQAVVYADGSWATVGTNAAFFYKATDPTGAWTSDLAGADGVDRYGILWTGLYWVSGGGSADNLSWSTTLAGTWISSVQPPVTPVFEAAYSGSSLVAIGSTGNLFVNKFRTREAWTSRGSGVQSDSGIPTKAGWIRSLAASEGTAWLTEWISKPLQAFTLSSAVRCNLRALETSLAHVAIGCEIAVINEDSSLSAVWGQSSGGQTSGELATTEGVTSIQVGGLDLSITNGQRIRIRLFLDDVSNIAMATGGSVTVYYAGTTGGASGDTFLTFSQTLTEFVAAAFIPSKKPYPQLLAH